MFLFVLGLVRWSIFDFLKKAPTSSPATTFKERQLNIFDALRQWIAQPGSAWIMALMIIYRLQDGLVDPQRDYFLQDMGFSKSFLAFLTPWTKWAEILGGLLVGFSIKKAGYFKSLKMALWS